MEVLIHSRVAIFICPTYFILGAFPGRSYKVRIVTELKYRNDNEILVVLVIGRICYPTRKPRRRRPILLPRELVSVFIPFLHYMDAQT